jgi:hypothetical protein
MKTWNIQLAMRNRWIDCGDITAPTFDEAREIAIGRAKAIKARGEIFSGGVSSLLLVA